jgi:hypothetical protein
MLPKWYCNSSITCTTFGFMTLVIPRDTGVTTCFAFLTNLAALHAEFLCVWPNVGCKTGNHKEKDQKEGIIMLSHKQLIIIANKKIESQPFDSLKINTQA